ncbi:SMI1/KNR4 family protein [Chryseobacterium schmidteae]|uniref:SMI1/KNR4 family protein n=1 Tax=Chryseobacterium schmidteae TaxID=2730404 RepID=UPI001588A0F2|nr:SMI1/KNR4 family protein [Chryseobacterium schmidteae]
MELFSVENPPIMLEDLKEFEAALGLSLPEDYKAHLLAYNGAGLKSTEVFFGYMDDGINLYYFHPIKYGNSLQSGKRDYLPEKYICIGCILGGYLAMSLDEQTYASIYSYYSEVELEYLASSFTEFVDGLIDYE